MTSMCCQTHGVVSAGVSRRRWERFCTRSLSGSSVSSTGSWLECAWAAGAGPGDARLVVVRTALSARSTDTTSRAPATATPASAATIRSCYPLRDRRGVAYPRAKGVGEHLTWCVAVRRRADRSREAAGATGPKLLRTDRVLERKAHDPLQTAGWTYSIGSASNTHQGRDHTDPGARLPDPDRQARRRRSAIGRVKLSLDADAPQNEHPYRARPTQPQTSRKGHADPFQTPGVRLPDAVVNVCESGWISGRSSRPIRRQKSGLTSSQSPRLNEHVQRTLGLLISQRRQHQRMRLHAAPADCARRTQRPTSVTDGLRPADSAAFTEIPRCS